ncbi:MAG: L-lysine 6-transaminase [Chloroflexi bacterium]|nr:L-lysine 6-transaminase [Chloroflexota bacterium]
MKPSDVHKTIGKHMLADSEKIVFDLENSHGAYMVDALTNREYIDFFTFFASMPIGHNHPKMREPVFLEKLMASAITKPTSSDLLTTLMAEFVETFGRVAMPENMQHLFVVSGGALAVENALKTAFDWKVRKNFATISAAENGSPLLLDGFGSKVIHFREAFHGRSGYTMSMTNTDDPRKYIYFPKFDWPRVVNPKLHFPLTEEGITEVKKVEEIALSQIETAVRQHPGDIAALIIEPIQGEGGDNHFRPEFMRELRQMADKHDFLFITDEIQSGMGLTGKMWAMQHTGVMPDIIAFGKKSQVCGIIAGPRIEEVQKHVFEEASRINSTFGGNLTDMVRCTRYLEIIEEENLLQHTAKMGEHMLTGLENVAEESKGVISNVRGKGLMLAFDLPDREIRQKMMDNLKINGLYALLSGEKSIRFRGMLDTPKDVIDKALEIVAASIPVD